VKDLEDALIEYVERYGLTVKARGALTASEKMRQRRGNAGSSGAIRDDGE
jgi:hypothetical protein